MSNRICIGLVNIFLSVAFITLFLIIGVIKNNINFFINQKITELERKVDEIYPGVLTKQMTTTEIKELIESSLETSKSTGIESVAENIIKLKIRKYTKDALYSINALERTNDKLYVKDAFISLKEISLRTVFPFISVLKVALIVLYLLFIVLSVTISKSLEKKNDTIVFGAEAEKNMSRYGY